MQPNEILEKLEAKGTMLMANQLIADSMAKGCDACSLIGPPPGAESLIVGEFSSAMPDANAQPTMKEPQQIATFELPTNTNLGMQ